jgi:amino acid transporter
MLGVQVQWWAQGFLSSQAYKRAKLQGLPLYCPTWQQASLPCSPSSSTPSSLWRFPQQVSQTEISSFTTTFHPYPEGLIFVVPLRWDFANGMTTVLLVGTMSQARYVTHIARTHMLPPWFAHIDQRTGNPIRATVASLVLTSAVTLFTSLSVLSNLLSVNTLMIFLLVAVALLVRHHYMPGQTSPQTMWRLLSLIFLIFGASVGIAAYWALSDGWVGHVSNRFRFTSFLYHQLCQLVCLSVFMYMYVYVCICMCMYVYVCVCMCMYVCIYVKSFGQWGHDFPVPCPYVGNF